MAAARPRAARNLTSLLTVVAWEKAREDALLQIESAAKPKLRRAFQPTLGSYFVPGKVRV